LSFHNACGYAADCKSVDIGSIPVRASKISLKFFGTSFI